jgi:PTH1 family peptidyl-tRNA hydrolase|eukprot:SAG25_NODE_260_length_10806_cov_39.327356_4_plen_95_part_00
MVRLPRTPAAPLDSLAFAAYTGAVGEEYEWTRHNVGFMVAEALATRWQLCFTRERSMRAFLATGAVGGRTVHVAKPTTVRHALRALVWTPGGQV